MDAREAYNWRNAAEQRAIIAKYADTSDYGLAQEIIELRRKAKTASGANRLAYEATMEEVWNEIFRRERENGDTE